MFETHSLSMLYFNTHLFKVHVPEEDPSFTCHHGNTLLRRWTHPSCVYLASLADPQWLRMTMELVTDFARLSSQPAMQ